MRRSCRFPIALAATAALIAACSPAPDPSATPPTIEAITLPALAGSLGANLVRTADERIVLSWLEPADAGHALRFATLVEGSWSAPLTVATGDDWFVNWADFPSVVPLAGDALAAHWLVRRPSGGYAYDIYTALSADGGTSWSAPARPHSDDTDTEHGFVTIYPRRDGAGLVWLDGRNTGVPGAAAGMTLRAGTLRPDGSMADAAEVDGLICDCCQTDVAISTDGPVAVYRDRTPEETRDIYVSRYVDGRWQDGRPVAKDGWTIPGCPVNGPVIASHGAELAVAWFTNAGDTARVRLARSADAAKTFGAPVDVATGRAVGRVGLVLLEDGTAIVSWLRSAGNGTADLLLAPVTEDGSVGAPVAVASGVTTFSVPQVVRDGDGVLAVWSLQDGASNALAAARVPLAMFTG